MTEANTMTELLNRLPPPKPMTLLEKLEHVTDMARRNPDNKAEIRWRLQFILEGLNDWPPASIIDAVCSLDTSHLNSSKGAD